MACRIGDIHGLSELRADLGVGEKCHSGRELCVKSLEKTSDGAMAGRGSILGYCQGIMKRTEGPLEHTKRFIGFLEETGAPWSHSHEICWNHRNEISVELFLEEAIAPLELNGRVPVVITELDPGVIRQMDEINAIMASRPHVAEGETILLRVLLENKGSVEAIEVKMREIIETAHQEGKMPMWWPLLQFKWGEVGDTLRKSLESGLLSYASIAVNPLHPQGLRYYPLEIINQIAVAQVPLGLASGINEHTGEITVLEKGTRITYSLFDYFEQLGAELPTAPTVIILGPSQIGWTDEMNKERLVKLLSVLRPACDLLWKNVPQNRRNMAWKMSA